MVATPDYDIFPEQLSGANGDLAGIRFGADARHIPLGIDPASIYDLTDLPRGRDLAQLSFEGRALASTERERRGWGPTPGRLDDGPTGPCRVAVRAEGGDRHGAEPPPRDGDRALLGLRHGVGEDEGAAVGPAGGDSGEGRAAGGGMGDLMRALGGAGSSGDGPMRGADARAAAGSSGEDSRTLAVQFDEQGSRVRSFASAVADSSEDKRDEWPLRGPRTAAWVCKFMEKQHRTPTNHHHHVWRATCKLSAGDAGVAQHECLCRALEGGARFDQLTLYNSVIVETTVRQVQRMEEKHKGRMCAEPRADGVR